VEKRAHVGNAICCKFRRTLFIIYDQKRDYSVSNNIIPNLS